MLDQEDIQNKFLIQNERVESLESILQTMITGMGKQNDTISSLQAQINSLNVTRQNAKNSENKIVIPN
mgnify:CR=1 FL=1|jgi:hypothetical protein|tara:strand:+ start:1759 stop:1962 length:204 start_codon:yes stop_codon:yes gene_type:complete